MGLRYRVLVSAMRGTIQQLPRAVIIERENVLRASFERNLAGPAKVFAAAHHYGRLGIADEILNLGALINRIERQKNIASPQRRQVQQHGFY